MRLIVGISGASGVVMGYALLKALREAEMETHLVVTEAASRTLSCETSLRTEDLKELADAFYDPGDMAARIASGSFAAAGMIVIPCSMKTLAGIVSGYADNLLLRAADVCLKEGRKVVLVPRETPLSLVHLRNLKAAAELGCAIVPPMLTFYGGADTVEKQIDHIVGKIFSRFGLTYKNGTSWNGNS
ncbi:MAG: UbiX family flavin prenyltransferase [Schwartzia sp.]|nr:UbiX family flavin prenyltransferase [Schwartzia sp. (in: firmicutes)]